MFDMSTTSTSTCHALSRKHQHGNRVSSIIQLYHMRSVYATTPVRQAGTAQLSTKYLHIAREALVSPKREEGWNYARTFQQQTWVLLGAHAQSKVPNVSAGARTFWKGRAASSQRLSR